MRDSFSPHSSHGPYLVCDIKVTELQPAVLITMVCGIGGLGGGGVVGLLGGEGKVQVLGHGRFLPAPLQEFRTRESQASSGGLQLV